MSTPHRSDYARLRQVGRHGYAARRVVIARSWLQRMVGLLSRKSLSEDEGLVIPQCRCIHTFGMRFPIDVICINRQWRVVALREHVGPWRIVGPVWQAWGVVELQAGQVSRLAIHVGDELGLDYTQDDETALSPAG